MSTPWRLQSDAAPMPQQGAVNYYEDEDCGIFWSNDPKTTIGEMVCSIGVLGLEEEMARVREFYRAAGVRI